MPLTAFMKIPDIDGESTAVGHEDEIDIHDIRWAIERETQSTGRRRARSRVDASPLQITKYIDGATPLIAKAVAQARSFDEVIISLRRDDGGAALDYLTITMTNATLSAYSMDGVEETSSLVRETAEIIFETISVRYVLQNSDGSAGDEIEVDIDVIRGL